MLCYRSMQNEKLDRDFAEQPKEEEESDGDGKTTSLLISTRSTHSAARLGVCILGDGDSLP